MRKSHKTSNPVGWVVGCELKQARDLPKICPFKSNLKNAQILNDQNSLTLFQRNDGTAASAVTGPLKPVTD